jgi:antitoxin HicB
MSRARASTATTSQEVNILQAYAKKVGSLLEFLRWLLELDGLPDYKEIVQRQFSDYIEAHPLSADQIRFLRAVQAVFTRKRRLQPADLYDPPLTAFGQDAGERWFAREQVEGMLAFAKGLEVWSERLSAGCYRALTDSTRRRVVGVADQPDFADAGSEVRHMEKTIEYYLNLPYTIELRGEPEEGWFVRVRELLGCMSQGDTAEEAVAMIREAMRLWLEVALEEGDAIPEPRAEEEYSGKFVVRMPRSLHRELVATADREGVSLNQYINVALAGAVGRRATLVPASSTVRGPSHPTQAAVLHESGDDYSTGPDPQTGSAPPGRPD